MIIRTENLVKTYKNRNVVDGVSIQVKKGEIVGLLGPNGAGKTTTFYMIVGIEQPSAGSVYVGDQDVAGMPMHLRSRLGIGYLAQEASIFRKLSVEDNLRAILETTAMTKDEREAKLESLLDEFNVQHVRKRKGSELSGGERRRVEIARCLAVEPNFILLDEPFAGVDPIAVADIQSIVSYLKQRGIGILITDHNVRETLSIVDRANSLSEGKILIEGDSKTIAESEIARKFYLGENFSM
ncbi:MAG: LPS export ABC transporter ATP-binding protein [Selenomonadales bacterium]|nr:LPS export ABC transporter ATP-binding protein [Selenomonadales bacterium]